MPAYLSSLNNLILRSNLPADKDPRQYGKKCDPAAKKKRKKKEQSQLLWWGFVRLTAEFAHSSFVICQCFVSCKVFVVARDARRIYFGCLPLPERAPAHLCALKIKRAVNSVFTHGSFCWIKARGCCVSLDSLHYARWMLMSLAAATAVVILVGGVVSPQFSAEWARVRPSLSVPVLSLPPSTDVSAHSTSVRSPKIWSSLLLTFFLFYVFFFPIMALLTQPTERKKSTHFEDWAWKMSWTFLNTSSC